MEGDNHCEAYTAIVWGGLLSRERKINVEAEAVQSVEGNMGSTVMRGAGCSTVVAGPITYKRIASEPGRSHVRPGGVSHAGPHREGEEL